MPVTLIVILMIALLVAIWILFAYSMTIVIKQDEETLDEIIRKQYRVRILLFGFTTLIIIAVLLTLSVLLFIA